MRKFEDVYTELEKVQKEFEAGTYTLEEIAGLKEDYRKLVQFSGDVAKVLLTKEKELIALIPEKVKFYPVLNQIDFLTDEQKIALDKHLSAWRYGQYHIHLHGLPMTQEEAEKTWSWMIEQKMLEITFAFECDECDYFYLSDLTPEQFKALGERIEKYNVNGKTEEEPWMLDDEDEEHSDVPFHDCSLEELFFCEDCCEQHAITTRTAKRLVKLIVQQERV